MTEFAAISVLEIGGSVRLGPDWRIIRADDERSALAALAALAGGVSVILIHSGNDSRNLVTALRNRGGSAAAVPIIVLGSVGDTEPSDHPGADVYFAASKGSDIATALSRWRPVALPDTYVRLETTFGVATVRGMARRLREVLTAALDALGTPAAAEVAHRVAGVAGTLGFGELGDRWLAFSHDPGADTAALRRETRRTIAALVRHT